jgi:hypothetical protein
MSKCRKSLTMMAWAIWLQHNGPQLYCHEIFAVGCPQDVLDPVGISGGTRLVSRHQKYSKFLQGCRQNGNVDLNSPHLSVSCNFDGETDSSVSCVWSMENVVVVEMPGV